MYLQTHIKIKEYMGILARLIPPEFMDTYSLHDKVYKYYVYMEIVKGMYGLPQVGQLVNDLLCNRLAMCGYIKCIHNPGLWRHIWRPVQFTLIVDDFGVKYVGVEYLNHLTASLDFFL